MQYSHPAVAIDTGSLNPNLNGKVLSTDIELKFWGFSKADVQSILPVTRLNQESYFADSNQSSQYYTKAYSSYKGSFFFDIVHNIRYKFTYLSPTYYDSLKLTIAPGVTNSSLANYVENGSTIEMAGVRLSEGQLTHSLNSYDKSESLYRIHILNLAYLDDMTNNRTHWIYNSPVLNYLNGESDFRNAGIVGPNSLYLDPTSFVPRISGTKSNMSRWQDLDATSRIDYLEESINSLVENVIVGSPYSNPYGVADLNSFEIHSSLIALTNRSKPYFSDVHNSVSDIRYQSKVQSLYPFTENFNDLTAEIDINTIPSLKSYIYDNLIEVNGSKYFVVTNQAADFLKNTIRNTNYRIYSKWPSGFFYMNMVWAFDENIKVMYQRDGNYTPYNQEVVGLGILDTSDWAKMSDIQRLSVSLTNMQLRVAGQIMGLHYTTEGVAKFIETPMSVYFQSRNQILYYNTFNLNQIMTKYSVIANLSVFGILSDYREELKVKNFDYIPHSELDKADLLRSNATILWQKGELVEATSTYLKAYVELILAIKAINSKINGIGNSVYWGLGLIMLISLVSILGSYELKKNKEIKRDRNGIPLDWLSTDDTDQK